MRDCRSLLLAVLALPLLCAHAEAAEHKYSLGLLHYNLEYVAGGGPYFEDLIITESFDPVLDLFLRHPDWGVNFELQAYMVEVLAQRFPAILDKVRVLANSGQCEFQCFHYSDPLWIAWPKTDLERSIARIEPIFNAHGIRMSPTVFTQEGQFSPSMPELMPQYGYETSLLPTNLLKYWHPGLSFVPWYDNQKSAASFGQVRIPNWRASEGLP